MTARDAELARDLLKSARQALERRGSATPALDARLLLQEASGVTREAMIADPDRTIGPEAAARFRGFIERRLTGEPVSRILGHREFYGRDFIVSPATLDPRPDTETLVEAALSLMPAGKPCRLVDLGTGTGAIALTLLAERPLAEAVLTDISADALAVARANAGRLGVAARAGFIAGNWFAGASGRFDLILSNPPYIPTAILPTLESDVRDFDPGTALDGGPDGLAPYREIAARAPFFIAARGHVIVEIGEGQAVEIEDIFRSSRMMPENRWKDLAGHVRCLGFTQA
ncbi:MAG: peptide chain release factor N(5)-glutamine methyltransferase [Pseudomonadota bacterium]